MIFKKPVLSSVWLIGILLCAIFISQFLLSFIDNTTLLLAIAETVVAVIGSMTLFFGAVYFIMKKRYQPNGEIEDVFFNHSGSAGKMSPKGTDTNVITIARRN